MKAAKKTALIAGAVLLLLAGIFLAGRYGWKLLGFRACQSAVIETVAVGGDSVEIAGYCPGIFPKGFCGCYSQERDGRLYVGFRFSAVFGFFETGDFDLTIPVKGEIREVIVKTGKSERSVWNVGTGS